MSGFEAGGLFTVALNVVPQECFYALLSSLKNCRSWLRNEANSEVDFDSMKVIFEIYGNTEETNADKHLSESRA